VDVGNFNCEKERNNVRILIFIGLLLFGFCHGAEVSGESKVEPKICETDLYVMGSYVLDGRAKEDRAVLVGNLGIYSPQAEGYAFAGVFDGHHQNTLNVFSAKKFISPVPQYLADHFPSLLATSDWMTTRFCFWPHLDIPGAFESACKSADREVKRIGASAHGSTLTSVLLSPEREIIVANVGDSRTKYYCFDDVGSFVPVFVRQTLMHDLYNVKEYFRVECCGASLSNVGGVIRINGSAAYTRSIGDGVYGDMVLSKPDVETWNFTGEGTEFLVLGSDGLWDVDRYEHDRIGFDVGQFVYEKLREKVSVDVIAEQLVRKAAYVWDITAGDWPGLETDDISAVIIVPKQKATVELQEVVVELAAVGGDKHE
jgi:serine/threonine protein phosphatase PrpC